MTGIYYPDFFFLDEFVHAGSINPSWSVANHAQWHLNRINWLLLVNDAVHIPLDNFVFVPTQRLMDVRKRFLGMHTIQAYLDHRLIVTNEHGELDFEASHELYQERRDSSGWQLGVVDGDISKDALKRIPTRHSNPTGEVRRFVPFMRNILANFELQAGSHFATIEDLFARAEDLNGPDAFSTEYFAEQLIKSRLPTELKRILLFHTRRAFYTAFALEPGYLHWYSDEMTPFDTGDGISQKEQANSFLYSPIFIEQWFETFLSAEERQQFLNAGPELLLRLHIGDHAEIWRTFQDYFQTRLIPKLDWELDEAARNGTLGTFLAKGVSADLIKSTVLGSLSIALPGAKLIEPLASHHASMLLSQPGIRNLVANFDKGEVRRFLKAFRSLCREYSHSS